MRHAIVAFQLVSFMRKGLIYLYRKVLAVLLAATMMASMSVGASAKTITRKDSGSSSTQTTTTSEKKESTKSTTTSTDSAVYDFCTTQLSGLAKKMHTTFVNGLRKYQDTIVMDVSGYSSDEISQAFQQTVQIIINQHAEIFWLNTEMQNFGTTADGKLVFYPRPATEYGTPDSNGTKVSDLDLTAIKKDAAKMDSIAKSITGSTRYELVKNIHDYVVNNSDYYAGSSDKHSFHQATGVLVEGTGVCDSYAKAFKYLCDKKGVPCLVVGGMASNDLGKTGTHAWNYVKMEDGKWYNIDTGWDDPVLTNGGSNEKYNYIYFLKNNVKDTRVKDNYNYPALSASDYAA